MRRFRMTALACTVTLAVAGAGSLLVTTTAHAALPASCDRTYTGTGTWSDTTKWTPGNVLPTSAENACFAVGAVVTVDSAAAAMSLNEVAASSQRGTLNINTGGNLTLGGTSDVDKSDSGEFSSVSVLNLNGGTLTEKNAPSAGALWTKRLYAPQINVAVTGGSLGLAIQGGNVAFTDGFAMTVLAGGDITVNTGGAFGGTITGAATWYFHAKSFTKTGFGKTLSLVGGIYVQEQSTTEVVAGDLQAGQFRIGFYDASNPGFSCGGCYLLVDPAGSIHAVNTGIDVGSITTVNNGVLQVHAGGGASAGNGCEIDNSSQIDVDGSLACTVFLNNAGPSGQGGYLTGFGTVTGNVIAGAGIVKPGVTNLDGETPVTPNMVINGGLTLQAGGKVWFVLTDAATFTYLTVTSSEGQGGQLVAQNLGGVNEGDTFHVVRSTASPTGSTPGVAPDAYGKPRFTDAIVGNDYVLTACNQDFGSAGCGGGGIPICPPLCPTPSPTPSTTPHPSSSAPVVNKPGAPTATTVTSGDGAATLTFTPPTSNGGGAITGYTVTATPVNAATATVRTATGAGSPITISGLTNGEAYRLTAHATNSAGDGPESNALETIVGNVTGVSLFLSQNPVQVGHSLRFYGYAADHGAPLKSQKVSLFQRLAKGKNGKLATVTTDAEGQYTYSLRLVHTGAVRALTVVGAKSIYSKELLAKVSFVLLKVKAAISGGHIVITGVITPGSPSPFGEAPDRVAIYKATADGKKGAYIGDAKLASTAKGAPKTAFRYDHKASVLGTAAYVYVNPLGTRANTSTHVTVHVKGASAHFQKAV